MLPYGKTPNLYTLGENKKRDFNSFTDPVFEYLYTNTWIFTEKVDGTNMRVIWNGETVEIRGRSDNASIPGDLYKALELQFPVEKFITTFDNNTQVCLYGEGYGGKIQSGTKYRPDKGFILFDCKIGEWWLERENIVDIAQTLGCEVVPEIGRGPLSFGIGLVEAGLQSRAGTDFGVGVPGGFMAEGLIARPEVSLLMRDGERVQVKIKARDFYEGSPQLSETRSSG